MSQFIAPPGVVLGSDGIATAPGFNVTAGTYDRYVDPAGSNSNDGLTALTPWQTINYALSKMPLLAGGLVNIHLKAGATFSENLLIPTVLGKSGDATFGVNAIKFIGDSSNYPIIVGNPVVQNATIKSVNNPTTIYLEGVEVRSSGAAGSTGISMLNSTLIMQDSKVNTCFSGVVLTNCYFSSNAGSVGNTIAATQTALQLAGAVSIFAKNLSLSVTSATGTGLVTNNSIIVAFGTMVLGITGTNSKYGMRFLNSGIFQQNSGGTVTITGFTAAGGAGAELNGTANWDISGPVTFDNVTQSTISIFDNGVVYDRSGAVFTFLNGSPTVIGPIDPGGVVKGAFAGATFSFAASQYKYGYDPRYSETVRGGHSGALPVGATNYLAHDAVQGAVFYLYRAKRACTVTGLMVDTVTGNGAAHTDTYTVVKNGVDTTMTLSITNGLTGSTVANPVDLVAGDLLSIKVVSDAATAAADVMAQMVIQQT